ncbi:M48 family metallopeptidase [Halomonas sp. V046]|uniref:M48 family metallopeptidase n=1 Tax=Halomonas sp. V046 TaxID=3459611 RepID=UPI004043B30A
MAVYIGGIWLMSYFAKSLITAHMLGHYVKVGPQQFPHLQQMVEESAAAIGLNEAPQAFIYNSGGMMNAFALKLVGRRRYIWLTSALIDADSDEQVRFVIGHEMAHHAAGHLDGGKHFLRLPARMVPFLGSAYSRACELTCDRAGSQLARDLSASRSALQMLACGSAKLNASMNPDAFQAQEQLVPPVAGFFIKIFATHPRTTRRVQALTEWYRGETTGVAVPLSASRA